MMRPVFRMTSIHQHTALDCSPSNELGSRVSGAISLRAKDMASLRLAT